MYGESAGTENVEPERGTRTSKDQTWRIKKHKGSNLTPARVRGTSKSHIHPPWLTAYASYPRHGNSVA